MPLTSEQKRYLKKNRENFSPAEIAEDLGISEKEVLDFFKKKFSQKKWERFIFSEKENIENRIKNFNFSQFVENNLWIFVSLSLLIFIVYFNSGNAFVSDDIDTIVKNKYVGEFKNIFSSIPGITYRFIHFSIYHLFGPSPWAFRFSNILFHLSTTFLVFIIFSLLAKRSIALMTAYIFAVHPILVESVAWISGGPYVLYSFFFLLSFLFYILSSQKKRLYFFSLIFFLMALNFSEKAMPLFLVFLFFEFSFGNLGKKWKKSFPYFCMSFFWVFLFIFRMGDRVSSVVKNTPAYQGSSSAWNNPVIQLPIAVISYFKLFFWPDKLSLYQTELAFPFRQYLVFVFLLFIFIGIILFSFKKNRPLFFWLSFFIISLLVTLVPLKISWIVAERYAYLGSIGIFFAVAWIFNWILEKNERAKSISYGIFVILILALSVRTITRNNDWKNEDTLWLATVKTSPSGQSVHNNLGDMYSRQNNLPMALSEFKKAVKINPIYAEGYHNLGNTYQRMGQIDEAISNYQKSIELNPSLWQPYQGLASIYIDQKNYQAALENIQKALALNPNEETLKQNLVFIEAGIQK